VILLRLFVVIKADPDSGEAHKSLQSQHQLTLANCLAQSRVLMLGDASTDSDENTPNFKRYRGNQPSTTLLLDELTPLYFRGISGIVRA
jgi:glucose-6-phosphate isomerase